MSVGRKQVSQAWVLWILSPLTYALVASLYGWGKALITHGR